MYVYRILKDSRYFGWVSFLILQGKCKWLETVCCIIVRKNINIYPGSHIWFLKIKILKKNIVSLFPWILQRSVILGDMNSKLRREDKPDPGSCSSQSEDSMALVWPIRTRGLVWAPASGPGNVKTSRNLGWAPVSRLQLSVTEHHHLESGTW